MKKSVAASLILLAACTSRPSGPRPAPPASTPAQNPPASTTSVAPDVVSTSATPAPGMAEVARFSTKFKYDARSARFHNISILIKKLEEFTVLPGEEFSFNKATGLRTKEAGFEKARSYFVGEIMEEYGGGTCQVSSTLHGAALYAGLAITERHPHSRPSSYVGPGLDAMVSYLNSCVKKDDPRICHDLRFRNPYGFPIHMSGMIPVQTLPELVDGSISVVFRVLAASAVPKVSTSWSAWRSPPFGKRRRRVAYWPDARTRLKQAGQNGLEGILRVTSSFPDGREEKREVFSSYKPVPEVWDVGMGWTD